MLRTLPPADKRISPPAKQESYFFNRIGRLLSFKTGSNRLWIQPVDAKQLNAEQRILFIPSRLFNFETVDAIVGRTLRLLPAFE